jgi:hypothetical protein
VRVDVMPSAIQGARLVGAHGRDVGYLDEDSDTTRKVCVGLLAGGGCLCMY